MSVFDLRPLRDATERYLQLLHHDWDTWIADNTHRVGSATLNALRQIAFKFAPNTIIHIDPVDSEDVPPHHCSVRVSMNEISLGVHPASLTGQLEQRLTFHRLPAIVSLAAVIVRDNADVDLFFVACLDDVQHKGQVAFCANRSDVTLIPDSQFINTLGYSDFRIQIAESWVEWPDRSQFFFWRGSTTGQNRPKMDYEGEKWFKIIQRTELCHTAKRSSFDEQIDVGITSIVQLNDNAIVDKIRTHYLKPFVSRSEQVKYRYFFDVDGNSNAWEGLFGAFILGGCVLKIASDLGYRQWYYDRLVPWEHFIPVRADLSDLEDVLVWISTHQQECQAIAEAGKRFIDTMDFHGELVQAAAKLRLAYNKN